jgi:hypothetical protein
MLAGTRGDGATAKPDRFAIQYEEELVVLVVLMPVAFSLHHALAHD